MIVFVDVDNVCADLAPTWFRRYNRDYNDHLIPEDAVTWNMLDYVKPECGVKIFDYLEDPSLYDEVNPMRGALEGVDKLRSAGHWIVYATASTNGAAGRKLRWLIEHGFLEKSPRRTYPNYVEIYDKSLLRGDVMIDDGIHNLQGFCGRGVLFAQPHNQLVKWLPRLNGWEDLPDLDWLFRRMK